MAKAILATQPVIWDRKWACIFTLVSIIMGTMLFFLPVHWVLLALIGMVLAGYLVLNPQLCLYLVVFTIPFTERIRILPISFSPNDLALLLCTLSVGLHMLIHDRPVQLNTRLDGWMWTLLVMFFAAGLFSASPRGLLSSFKFLEAVLMFYMTIYLIRAHVLTRSDLIKCLLYTALFQAGFGIVQSVTGQLGANYISERGYLGYLGLGSRVVWHGRGTMEGFNTLGNYLVATFLLVVPFMCYVVKNKVLKLGVLGFLLLGILTTYSRGSLLGLAAGGLFMIWFLPHRPYQWNWLIISGMVLLMLPIILFFSNSSYLGTLSYAERLVIWQVPLAAITASTKAFWLGNGLNSYEVVAWPYIPGNVPMVDYPKWFAHNYYLLTMVELGLLGSIIYFGFLLQQWHPLWIQLRQMGLRHQKSWNSLMRLSMSAVIVSIFFVSIFDHSYDSPYFKIYLFLLLGVLHVHPGNKKLTI